MDNQEQMFRIAKKRQEKQEMSEKTKAQRSATALRTWQCSSGCSYTCEIKTKVQPVACVVSGNQCTWEEN